MKNSKIARILFVLDTEVLKQLEVFIKSKIIEKTSPLWTFFLIIKKQLAFKEEANWEKEYLFQKIFPKEDYQDGKMRKLMHELWLEIETFIILQQKEKDFEKEIHLLDFYYEHYLTKDFQECLARLLSKLTHYDCHNLTYWKGVEKVEVYKSYAIGMRYVYQDNMNIPKILESQMRVFFIQQLRYYFYLYANQELSRDMQINPFLHDILSEIERNDYWLENTLLSIYYHAVCLFIREEVHTFTYLREMLKSQPPILSYSEWAALAFGLRNFVGILKFKRNEFHKIHFELYLEHLSMGFIFSNNYIPPQTAVNICDLGIALKEFAKVENFLDDYQQYFPPNLKDNLLLLCNAHLLYGKTHYEAALKYLNVLEKFEHFTFDFTVRCLKIKILYEMQEPDLCIYQLNAFQVFVYRHKNLAEEQKLKYQNFCRIMLKICKLKPENALEKVKLREEVSDTKLLVHKTWILSLF